MENIKVAVVDQSEVMLGGYLAIIKSDPKLELSFGVLTGKECIDSLRICVPDIILLDAEIVDLKLTEELLRSIRKISLTIKIVVTGNSTSPVLIESVLRRGAFTYFLKSSILARDFSDNLKLINRGFIYQSRLDNVVRSTIDTIYDSLDTEELESLTQREQEVLMKICQGKSKGTIATELFVSASTIKFHIQNLLFKTCTKNTLQLVVKAYKNEWMVILSLKKRIFD